VELTKISDIEGMLQYAQALFEWSAVPLGSPLRVHAYSYRNWGIVITPLNVEWLHMNSRMAFLVEWAKTDAGMNRLIAEASQKAGLSDVNAVMNARIGEHAAEHLATVLKNASSFSLIDIGSGAGGTILAVVKCLLGAGLSPDATGSLTLLEPSPTRLETAEANLRRLLDWTRLGRKLKVIGIPEGVGGLAGLPADSADGIVTCGAIHHESFNEHLPEIARVLKPGMQFISGDWHESNYVTPARVYWMYYMLQDPHNEETANRVIQLALGKSGMQPMWERKELVEFRRLFGLDREAVVRAFDGLAESERRANAGGMLYWLEMGKRFTEENKKSPEFLLQSHERVSKRTECIKNAGLVFDEECRGKYSELLDKKGFGELAAVMVAKKKSGCQPAFRTPASP
jgi:SAM-dependent methyltransferase